MNSDQRRNLTKNILVLTCLKSYRKDKSQILEPDLLLSVSKAFTKPTFCVFTSYVIQFLVIVLLKALGIILRQVEKWKGFPRRVCEMRRKRSS